MSGSPLTERTPALPARPEAAKRSPSTGVSAAITSEGVAAAIADALNTIEANLALFAAVFPDDTTADGVYPVRTRPGMPDGSNVGWTTSFWPGMLWLAYQVSGEPRYRDAAERFVPSFARRLEERVDLDTHDLGFLYTLGCVVPWRLTGDADARDAALRAADHLMTRYLEPVGIIQAWGDLRRPEERGRTIIDSLMNTPLLYWASSQTGDARYARAAGRHTQRLRDHMLRDEGSTFHTFFWDPETGEPLRGATEQGHADDSCWARGQAWGIYGFAINYRLSGETTLLEASRRCADYFLRHLPADRVPHWDLALTGGDGEPRDSSAAAIAATGLMELAQLLDADSDSDAAGRYRREAIGILGALISGYATAGASGGRALIDGGVYDAPKNIGVNEGNLWGDYFYLEALVRTANPDWESFW
jgi:unsaturated chondroitin disaccharide hydrolase